MRECECAVCKCARLRQAAAAKGRERPGHAWVGASPVGAPGARSAERLPGTGRAAPREEATAEAAGGDGVGCSKGCPYPESEERGAAVGVR